MSIKLAQNSIKVDDSLTLEMIADSHAAMLLNLVNANKHHLREWLPWVDSMKSLHDFKSYITRCKNLYNDGSEFGCVILKNDLLVGRVGIHYINRQNSCGAIGYWLGSEFSGQGTITKSCEAIIKYGFSVLQLNRLEIKCGTGNRKSAAIAERLKFKEEGILRQAEFLNGQFIDLNLYSLLKEEWKNKKESTSLHSEQEEK